MSKEREDFEKSIAANIENFCDAAFDGKYYVMRNNSRLKQSDKEFLILSLNRSWSAWQAAKVEAVPEGFVLVEKDLIQSIHQSCNNALDINDRDIYKGLCMAIIDDVEAMIEAQQPSSTSGCPDEP